MFPDGVENNETSCCGSIVAYEYADPLLLGPPKEVEYGELDGLSKFKCGAKSYAGEYAQASGGAVAVVGEAKGLRVLFNEVNDPAGKRIFRC